MLAEFIVPTVKHGGGSVMVRGCFSTVGVRELIKVENTIRKEDYKQILAIATCHTTRLPFNRSKFYYAAG